MGQLDEVFNQGAAGAEPEPLDEHESFAAIALALAAADGSVDDIEVENLVTYLRRMHFFKDFETAHFVRLFERLFRHLNANGSKGLIAAARHKLPDSLRETAFALALDVALADGVIDNAEKELMADLREVLAISDELALKITDVMIIKNRG
ncbi:MAG: tellurite resistance TerB family protein [Polyangiaceae bacterium]